MGTRSEHTKQKQVKHEIASRRCLYVSRFTFYVSRKTQHATRNTPHEPRITSHSAFTLIELVLVMAVVVIAIAITAPRLANFFRGRTLDSEARRLLALTHAGQSRAVSEGIPMRLWLDAEQRTYGLQEEAGWDDRDPKAIDFTMDHDLQLEIIAGAATKQRNGKGLATAGVLSRANTRNLPEIRFLTDGTIDQTSPRAVKLIDRDTRALWLTQSTNHLNYEIRKEFE